jgi:pimeloyl-ACP methyl ester carboxylesterase
MTRMGLSAAALANVATALALAAFVDASSAQALTECRVPGIRNSVQCGVVQRALDPARPEGTKIDVHYVVVPAMARRKLPDPVFLLAGGPGQSAIGVAPQTLGLFARLNNRRDIVFVDQRGTGQSAPLECADPERETLAEQADPDQQLKSMRQCKADLSKRPYLKTEADLRFFTTTIAMQDLDAVRQQLGAERLDLVGISYGTRAALEYMRQFPAKVRRAVLDSVAPPDMALPASFSTDGQAALDSLFASCTTQPACAAAYPHLHDDWTALLKSLPKTVTAAHPLTGAPETFTMTREMVLGAIRGALYSPAAAAALPAAIEAAASGRYEALAGVGSLLGSRRGIKLALGMHFSVVCAEDMPLMEKSTDKPGADFGDEIAKVYEHVCAEWPRGAVPAAFYSMPRADIATLLLSGGIDPATPPRHGARVVAALGPEARQIVVPNAGHGVVSIGCGPDLLFKFIDAETDAEALAVDASCVTSIPRPGVFRPITTAGGEGSR